MKIITIGGYLKQTTQKSPFSTPIEIDQKILKISGKKQPKVLFIPTASSDSETYIQAFLKNYEDTLKCHVQVLKLIKEKPTKQEINQKISQADIIYVGGGNTLKMLKKWRKLSIDKLLRQAAKTKVLCGCSAGAICWFEYGVSDSLQFYNKKSHKYVKVKALGLIPGIHCPHFGSKIADRGYRSKGAKKIMKNSSGTCIAITDACAIYFTDKNYEVLSGSPKAKAYITFWSGSKYYIQELPKNGLLKDLQ